MATTIISWDIPAFELPGYEIQGKLNDGGTSSVWKGKHISTGMSVAIKILKDELKSSWSGRKAFFNEATILKKLDHPRVMQFFDTVKGKFPAIIMPYFAGDNLKLHLMRRPEFVKKNRLRICLQVSNAMYYIHQKHIVHNDFKPENILVNSQGDSKLIDFAMAQQTSWLAGILGGGKNGALAGSPTYMAPELIKKEKSDHRADIYALGVTMWEVVAGQPPFLGKSPKEILQSHLRVVPKPLVEIYDKMPPKVSEYVEQMLLKDPTKRLDSLEPLVKELKALYKEKKESGTRRFKRQ